MRETRALFTFILLGIFIISTRSYRSPFTRYHTISCRAQESLKCSNSANIETISTSEAEMDRLLLENDDDDGDEEHDAEAEVDDLDINMIADSDIDRSIQNAVQKLVDSGPKEPELSRVETFDNIYKSLKSKSKDDSVKLDHTSILAALFADTQRKDPFDEKKVMMKFRTMLKNEDFENLFRDPLIGDFL